MTHRPLIAIALLGMLLAPRAAEAYIDPGTTQSLFTFLAPVFALLGVFLGYVLWPFRYAIFHLFRKAKPPSDAPPPASEEPPKPE
ncbi:MAG TPA: hypothetical protein PLE19_16795 [Planctomycetota bacterium]|nr:hypothetical protein [Planctomycetota bacterium]HRR79889.1 hypothetical protein [Planctomycetota bacterium]HRT95515.1 hypothetical protein [Planctomycetota bacterium]